MILTFLINNFVIIGFMYIKLILDKFFNKNMFVVNSAFFGLMSTFVIMIPFKHENLIFDLRAIPIIFATYCFGWKVGVGATILPIVYRYFYLGDLSTLFIFFTLMLHFVIPIVISNYFHRKDNIKTGSFLLTRSLLIISFTYYFTYIIFGLIITPVPVSLLLMVSLIILLFTIISLLVIAYMRNEAIKAALLQLKMLKSEKMEVVSHLAASISHEVRNPLTVVKGFLQLLKKGDLNLRQREYIDLSIKEIDRANAIIVNYLTFAKPAPNNIKGLNISEELNKVISIIKPMANMNAVKLKIKAESHLMEGESQLLQQCLLNIIKNCIEAMPKGGEIKIETKRVKENLVIKILDNGAGMTKEQLSRLGEPYFTTKDEGTGLGMMAAIRIIESLKGKLNVTSQLDVGTEFTLTFPIVSEEKDEVAAANEMV
ncbi:MAG: ATP-binding protein [Bacillus sp. (in: Bacteria)]|nr:ATP-binding protein [Bacillus sp. (in: firmicutes)]